MSSRMEFRRTLGQVGGALTVIVMTGCDLLTVDNPSSILDEDLNSEGSIPAISAGVAGDFNAAYTSTALWAGLLSDELIHTGTAPAERNVSLGEVDVEAAAFNALAAARWVADDAVRRFRELLPDADSRSETANASVYAGFALLLLADNHCEIPLDGAPAQLPAGIYAEAEERFMTALAIATAANDGDAQQRAYAGRARARLMQGMFAEAITDAQQVATGFVFESIHSETTQNNAFPSRTIATIRKEISVHPRIYGDVRFQADPRVPFVDNGELGVDGSSTFVEQRKYLTRADEMQISSWQEARLIEAEAEVRLDDPAAAVLLIDEVRSAAGLGPYTGPVTAPAVLDQIIYERAAELFLEGQRLNDQRRFDDPWLDGRGTCFDISQQEKDANPNVD